MNDLRRYIDIVTETRLDELHGVKRFHQMTQYEVLASLFPEGSEVRLDGGKYGTVIDNPKWDYVIKFWHHDDCYLQWVTYVLANPHPNFPRFVKRKITLPTFFRRAKDSTLNYLHAVRIEKLKPLPKAMGTFVIDRLNNADIRVRYHLRGEEPFTYHYPSLVTGPTGEAIEVRTDIDLWDHFPWLKDLEFAWYKVLTETDFQCATDMHAGNFMLRDDGTVVICDPFWYGMSFWGMHDAAMEREYGGMADDSSEYMEPDEYKAHQDKKMIDGGKQWDAAAFQADKEREEQERARRRAQYDTDDDPPF